MTESDRSKCADLEQIREYFREDRFATDAAGITIEEKRPGYARVSLVPGLRHKNAAGRIMGAVYFTMADFAFAVANNGGPDDPLTVTTSSTIDFLAPAAGTKLFAEARALQEGRKITFYEISVTDDSGKVCAVVLTKGCRIGEKPR